MTDIGSYKLLCPTGGICNKCGYIDAALKREGE